MLGDCQTAEGKHLSPVEEHHTAEQFNVGACWNIRTIINAGANSTNIQLEVSRLCSGRHWTHVDGQYRRSSAHRLTSHRGGWRYECNLRLSRRRSSYSEMCLCAFGGDPMPFYNICYRIWMFCCNMWEIKVAKKIFRKNTFKKTIQDVKQNGRGNSDLVTAVRKKSVWVI